ncbi:hypothetical protein FSHL1_009636 [Fusarium sambucinum]
MLIISWFVTLNYVFAIPEPTKRRDLGYLSQPDPTSAIEISQLRHLELGKRQQTSMPDDLGTFTLVVSPDSTCGYVSGSAGSGIICPQNKKCSWEIGTLEIIICDTIAYTQCFNSETALNTKTCDDACQSNELNLLCTKTAQPYCGTYSYEGSISQFRCVKSSMDIQNVSFSYDGQRGRTFNTREIPVNDVFGSASDIIRSSTVESNTASSSTSTTDLPERNGTSRNKPQVGVIVGATVGGLAVLVALGFLVFWHRRKKNRISSPNEQKTQPTTLATTVFSEAPTDNVICEAPGDTVFPNPPVSR